MWCTYGHFAPGTADGNDFFLLEELLLETLAALFALAVLSSPMNPVVPHHLVLPVVADASIPKGGLALEVDL